MKLAIEFERTPVNVLGARSVDIVLALEQAGISQAQLAEMLDYMWTRQRISQFLSKDYLGDEPCEARFLQALSRLEF